MSTFMRAYLRFGRTSVTIVARVGHSDFGWCSHTSFESLRTPRSLRRDASLEQANPSLMGDRKFASDP
jgi:hypothetical protein